MFPSTCCHRHQQRRQEPQRQKARQQQQQQKRHIFHRRRRIDNLTMLFGVKYVLIFTLLIAWTVIHRNIIVSSTTKNATSIITISTETTTTTTALVAVEQQRMMPQNRFMPAMTPKLTRTKNFLTTTSGCRLARWVYPTGTIRKRFRDCSQYTYNDAVVPKQPQPSSSNPSRLLSNASNNSNTTTTATTTTSYTIGGIQPYDTIYVTIQKLRLFVETILPTLNVDVVLLSGQIYKLPTRIPTNITNQILGHPHILHWFCQNLDTNIGVDAGDYDRKKLSPFPYGLKEVVHKHDMTRQYESFRAYNQIYEEVSQGNHGKVDYSYEYHHRSGGSIYWGPISGTAKFREGLPGFITSTSKSRGTANVSSGPVLPTSSVMLSPLEFYRNVSKHQFVVSPVGDRTETYRHYEALGLGTIPIILTDVSTSTSTSSYVSSRDALQHLEPGPVLIINVTAAMLMEYNRNWTYLVEDHVESFLSNSLKSQLHHQIHVNREMVLESYWIQHMEDVAGHQLHWSDRILSSTQD